MFRPSESKISIFEQFKQYTQESKLPGIKIFALKNFAIAYPELISQLINDDVTRRVFTSKDIEPEMAANFLIDIVRQIPSSAKIILGNLELATLLDNVRVLDLDKIKNGAKINDSERSFSTGREIILNIAEFSKEKKLAP